MANQSAQKQVAKDKEAIDVVPEETASIVPPADNGRLPDEMSFAELLQGETFKIAGFTNVDKDEMIGVPHAITRVTYWQGSILDPETKVKRDFVSVEATVADRKTLETAIRRGWVPNINAVDELKFSPEERVVYNDGSTGIRRQLTDLLDSWNLIQVGHKDLGDKRYDLPWSQWESFTETRKQGDLEVPSCGTNPNGNTLVINCARGLSVSNYTNDYGDSTTYYLR